uniref:Mannosyltransferase n=1 Tax=Branchiostoma floridae TaxID=7739 RepID=C3ZIX8_BRAFL|eukprot:XP_002591483.1 hypothetical protein BRAFLDRAFT_105255 [Branchiostoma floridae]
MAGGSRNRAGKPPPRLRPHHAEKQSHGNERREEEVVTVQSCWAPSFHTAFKVLLSARFCAALLSNISDCDETYNYWEPTHYLMYGKGFQTWEYSPAYGLRSYIPTKLFLSPMQTHYLMYGKGFQTWEYSPAYGLRSPTKLFLSPMQTHYLMYGKGTRLRTGCVRTHPLPDVREGFPDLGVLACVRAAITHYLMYGKGFQTWEYSPVYLQTHTHYLMYGKGFQTWEYSLAYGLRSYAPTKLLLSPMQTHYLMYGKGFQTWEYSPAYGLRSYAYVWLHILPALFHSRLLRANKVLIFYFIRCVLGFFCALAEAYFYNIPTELLLHDLDHGCHGSVVDTLRRGQSFISISYLKMLLKVAIFSIAVSAIVGWPFAGALGIPIAVDLVLRRQRVALFCQWVIISLCLVLVPLVMVDTLYYGKLVIAPLNIVLYNVFSDHGPDIYGVEPWTFYFLNGFLNFNVVFLMGLVAMPLGEERFLFPVYPLICLCAAVTLASFQKLYHFTLTERKRQHYTIASNWVAIGISVLYGLLCVSRSVALFQGISSYPYSWAKPG